MHLTEEQLERYSRQILAHPFGGQGQRALALARVRLFGMSECLAPAGLYLARAGVGHLAVPKRVWETIARSASPDTIWHRAEDESAGTEAGLWDVAVDAGADPAAWHRRVRRQAPRVAALWLGHRSAIGWVALWSQPLHNPCPLDAGFDTACLAPSRKAGDRSVPLGQNVAWCVGTLAATLALRCLVSDGRDGPSSTWLVLDLAQGRVWQRAGGSSLTSPCRLCSEGL